MAQLCVRKFPWATRLAERTIRMKIQNLYKSAFGRDNGPVRTQFLESGVCVHLIVVIHSRYALILTTEFKLRKSRGLTVRAIESLHETFPVTLFLKKQECREVVEGLGLVGPAKRKRKRYRNHTHAKRALTRTSDKKRLSKSETETTSAKPSKTKQQCLQVKWNSHTRHTHIYKTTYIQHIRIHTHALGIRETHGRDGFHRGTG